MKLIFTAEIQRFNSDLFAFHVKVPDEVAIEILSDENKRILVDFNDAGFQVSTALFPLGDNKYFINLGKDVRKKLKVDKGDHVKLTITRDTSPYGMPMPEEMQAILHEDPEGSECFHALTPGKQRSLIYLVSKVKSSEKRLGKAYVIITFLRENSGNLDFKELNAAFKAYNNR